MTQIPSNDYGNNITLEQCQKFDINTLVREFARNSKKMLVEGQIKSLGRQISCTTTKTNYSGKRLWFICPSCNRRVGTVYLHPITNVVGCCKCLRLPYKSSRFKGMIENEIR